MEHDRDAELDPQSASPGLNDEIDKTVENNGQVRPAQYPREDRAEQVAVVDPKAEREQSKRPEQSPPV